MEAQASTSFSAVSSSWRWASRAASGLAGLASRVNPWSLQRDPQALEADYTARLAAPAPHNADLDELGFLRTGLRDTAGRAVVLVLARNFSPRACPLDALLTYLVQRLDAIADEPYTVVWVHTCASYWDNCPSLSWLYSAYCSLPGKFRSNLRKAYVLHCDSSLWLGAWALLPLASPELWQRLEWVSRLEFLADVLPKQQLLEALPGYVLEHDGLLEEEPLVDYGIVKETLQYAEMPVR